MSVPTTAKRVLVPIGNGSEDIEASCIVDTLRRAQANVTVASVECGDVVTMSQGMKIVADAMISACSGPYDAIVLPGGVPGADRLRDSADLKAITLEASKTGKIVAAICASPAVVLHDWGLLDGAEATCYPAEGYRKVLKNLGCSDVVVSKGGKLITSTGPGTSIKFALMVVEKLYGKKTADQIASDMLVAR